MKKGHKRLLALADFLDRKVSPDQFNYDQWVCGDWPALEKLDHLDLHQCGTTGCALGWATAMPRFRRLGLRLDRAEVVLGTDYYAPRGTSAAQALFDLSYDDAEYLFIPGEGEGYYTPPSAVADKIRKYVEDHSK